MVFGDNIVSISVRRKPFCPGTVTREPHAGVEPYSLPAPASDKPERLERPQLHDPSLQSIPEGGSERGAVCEKPFATPAVRKILTSDTLKPCALSSLFEGGTLVRGEYIMEAVAIWPHSCDLEQVLLPVRIAMEHERLEQISCPCEAAAWDAAPADVPKDSGVRSSCVGVEALEQTLPLGRRCGANCAALP